MSRCPRCGTEVYADESMCSWCASVVVVGTLCWLLVLGIVMWLTGGRH